MSNPTLEALAMGEELRPRPMIAIVCLAPSIVCGDSYLIDSQFGRHSIFALGSGPL